MGNNDDGKAKITSADIRAALLLRYPANSHSLMHEVAPETGGGTVYADAVAVGLWRSHGHKIEGIEIKVSRSDFLSEMKQPEKSQPVFRFCNHWWLAAPKGMVEPDELPPTWGLLELHDNGTLREKKKAPKLEAEPITIGFFASLCRRSTRHERETLQSMLSKSAHEQRENIERQLRMEFERKNRTTLESARKGLELLDKIKQETGIDLAEYRAEDWLKAIKVVDALGISSTYGIVSSLQQHAKSLLKAVDSLSIDQQ